MKVIGPLMWEHRLIERIIPLLRAEEQRLRSSGEFDGEFAAAALDFFRTYADRCHHGKEEEILFKGLAGKDLAAEHRRMMEELLAEHVEARSVVGQLEAAGRRCASGDRSALGDVAAALGRLAELYPPHIEKEDKRFFYPSMDYLTEQEQEALLKEFLEFDQKLIHEKYQQTVDAMEKG